LMRCGVPPSAFVLDDCHAMPIRKHLHALLPVSTMEIHETRTEGVRLCYAAASAYSPFLALSVFLPFAPAVLNGVLSPLARRCEWESFETMWVRVVTTVHYQTCEFGLSWPFESLVSTLASGSPVLAGTAFALVLLAGALPGALGYVIWRGLRRQRDRVPAAPTVSKNSSG
jgi:hypothetical protein